MDRNSCTRQAAQTFRDLLVWQKAHEFVLGVYQLTTAFPRQETFGLSPQMRRASVSIAANIVEGFAKRSKAEKARFLNMAEGSQEESRYYLILTEDSGYGKTEELLKLVEEVSRLLNRYAHAILASGSWLPYPWRALCEQGYQGRSPRLVGSSTATPVA